MKKIWLQLVIAFTLNFGCSISSHAQITLSSADLQPIIGSWQGSLTYLDYTSRKPYTMSAHIDIEQMGRSNTFLFSHSFPKEPHANWTDTIIISKDGTFLNNETIRSKKLLETGNLEIITEVSGIDGNDNKPALIKHIYTIGRDVYVHRKDVQFVGETEWIKRNEYTYSTRAKLLTPQQMKSDLALLKSTWENIHPGLYRYNTKAQIDNYFKTLDAQTNEVMEQRSFFILISQLNIKLQCGHSYVSYYNNKKILKNNLYSSVFMPLLYRVIEGKFIVTHNLSDNATITLGDEITAINGIPTQTIIDSLLTVSKADGNNGLNKKLDNIAIYPHDIETNQYALFDIYFPLFFKPKINDDHFYISIKSTNSKTFAADLKGLTKEQRLNIFNEKYGIVPKNEKSWFIKPIDTKTVVLRLGDFTTYNWKFDFNKYLDSVFTRLDTAHKGSSGEGYQNLIVDIRHNEGGADEARDAVLSYLSQKPLDCANPIRRLYRYQVIPDSLLAHLDTWDNNFKKPKSDKDYYKTADGFVEKRSPQSGCTQILPKPHSFKGKIYLITDVSNSSATFVMADVFKRNKLGTIVGEKTGGTQQGINGGEIFFFYLPHSKIEMDLPLIYQAPKNQRPDEGILPDYDIKTTVSDILNGRDPQLDFIINQLIKN